MRLAGVRVVGPRAVPLSDWLHAPWGCVDDVRRAIARAAVLPSQLSGIGIGLRRAQMIRRQCPRTGPRRGRIGPRRAKARPRRVRIRRRRARSGPSRTRIRPRRARTGLHRAQIGRCRPRTGPGRAQAGLRRTRMECGFARGVGRRPRDGGTRRGSRRARCACGCGDSPGVVSRGWRRLGRGRARRASKPVIATGRPLRPAVPGRRSRRLSRCGRAGRRAVPGRRSGRLSRCGRAGRRAVPGRRSGRLPGCGRASQRLVSGRCRAGVYQFRLPVRTSRRWSIAAAVRTRTQRLRRPIRLPRRGSGAAAVLLCQVIVVSRVDQARWLVGVGQRTRVLPHTQSPTAVAHRTSSAPVDAGIVTSDLFSAQ